MISETFFPSFFGSTIHSRFINDAADACGLAFTASEELGLPTNPGFAKVNLPYKKLLQS